MDKWRNRQAYIPIGTAYYSSQQQLHIHNIETPAKFIAHLLETGNFFESHTPMKGYAALVFCRYAGYERMTTAGLATSLYQEVHQLGARAMPRVLRIEIYCHLPGMRVGSPLLPEMGIAIPQLPCRLALPQNRETPQRYASRALTYRQ